MHRPAGECGPQHLQAQDTQESNTPTPEYTHTHSPWWQATSLPVCIRRWPCGGQTHGDTILPPVHMGLRHLLLHTHLLTLSGMHAHTVLCDTPSLGTLKQPHPGHPQAPSSRPPRVARGLALLHFLVPHLFDVAAGTPTPPACSLPTYWHTCLPIQTCRAHPGALTWVPPAGRRAARAPGARVPPADAICLPINARICGGK